MIAFIKLIRFPNLMIVFLTQLLTACCLYTGSALDILYNFQFWLILISTLLTTAAGYIINDYLDVNMDEINKPDRVIIGTSIKRKHAIIIHILFNVLAVFIMAMVSYTLSVVVLVIGLLLIKYSSSYKKKLLIGNILIAVLCSATLIILYFWNHQIRLNHLVAYSVFAFIATFNREIIKDAEDIKGDRMNQCNTFPIAFGIQKTKQLLYIVNAVLVSAGIIYFYQLYEVDFFRYTYTSFVLLMYAALAIIAPLFYMIFLLINARRLDEFSKLSALNKWIMLAGILSLIFFKL